MRRIGLIPGLAVAAAAALGMSSSRMYESIEPVSRRTEGHRINRRDEDPDYPRNIPTTPFDHERIRLADAKRTRKAVKRLRDQCRTEAGYYWFD